MPGDESNNHILPPCHNQPILPLLSTKRMDSDFDAFDQPYLRYDWRGTGRVGTAEFVRSTVSCGFPFTRAQVNNFFFPG